MTALYNIGIDIGGTKIWAALVNLAGGPDLIEDDEIRPTPTEGPVFFQTLVDLIQSLHAKAKQRGFTVQAVGISTAGTVDSDRGIILGSTANLPAVRDIANLKELLEPVVNLPVHVENDANAAAFGEYAAGAAVGYPNVVMITLGTGVGTGMILNHQMIRGAHFWAGEGGHIAISMTNERACTCGRMNCWEAYASGTGLKKTIQQHLQRDDIPGAELSAFLKDKKSVSQVDTHDWVRAWDAGVPAAQAIYNSWHEHIAAGIRTFLNILDPDVLVIGGGLGKFVDYKKLHLMLTPQIMSAQFKLEPAQLGNQSGIVGAAFLARAASILTPRPEVPFAS